MSIFSDDIVPIVKEVMTLLRDDLRREADAQGHTLTGRMSDSIEFEVVEETGMITGRMYAEDYSTFVELGVKAERIPYSGRSGRGGTSLYIQGLVSFWEERGLSDREALSAAFATAAVHKREGMPTRASYRYSQTGERIGFIQTTVERNLENVGAIIEEKFGAILELNFAESLGRYENIKIYN